MAITKKACSWGILLGSLCLATVALAAETDQKASPDQVKNFTLNDQDGNPVTLSDYRGRIVVLEWTNPQCPFVNRHYADDTRTMVKLAKAYKDKGVVWLAVNSTSFHTRMTDKEWYAAKKLPYPVLDDHEGKVGRLFGATNTPDMFVLDRQGKVVYQGAIDDNGSGNKEHPTNYVAAALNDLLAGKPLSVTKTKPYGCTVKYAR